MQFMLLIYENEAQWDGRSKAENEETLREYGDFTAGIKGSGKMVAGDALQPTPTAKTVRNVAGKTVVTDGPFAETREQLGGYYLIEAKDIEEATQIAARIPTARRGHGPVEVRPILVFGK